jgi:hypothetical protein
MLLFFLHQVIFTSLPNNVSPLRLMLLKHKKRVMRDIEEDVELAQSVRLTSRKPHLLNYDVSW